MTSGTCTRLVRAYNEGSVAQEGLAFRSECFCAMPRHSSYFLVSVSNKENLNLCIEYALAGFTNSINGVWTYLDIKLGDFVSFLYGAKAHNLYLVEGKASLRGAETAPPWPPVHFKQSGKTYYFPFRLQLRPVRHLEESLVRAEFSYVAENLLLRGGYRRTHFQADQTTLQAVSQMGELWHAPTRRLEISDAQTYTPLFAKHRDLLHPPEVFRFQELILQGAIRAYLSQAEHLKEFLGWMNINMAPDELEVLGEKALPEGFADLLIKEATPAGMSRKILLEVKTSTASPRDVEQLRYYMTTIGQECMGAALIASGFPRKALRQLGYNGITALQYEWDQLDMRANPATFEQLVQSLRLAPPAT